MSQLELIKNELHQLIDRVDDEAVLSRLLGTMATEVEKEPADFWDELTPAQQADAMEGYAESEDEANLIPNELLKQQLAQ